MMLGIDQAEWCDQPCRLPDLMPGSAIIGIATWLAGRVMTGERFGTAGDPVPGHVLKQG